MSDQQRFVKYGDRTMPLEAGMTLEQAKELMARHFPELANPKVEKKEQGGKTIYVFTKQAGYKGAPDGVVDRLIRVRRERVDPDIARVVAMMRVGYTYLADQDIGVLDSRRLPNACEAIAEEGARVAQIGDAMLAVPSIIAGGSVL